MSNANYMYMLGQAVPERDKYRVLKGADLPQNDTITNAGAIGYGEYFSICGYRVSGDDWPDITIQYRVLLSHDGISNHDGVNQFTNAVWGPWQGLAALTNIVGSEFDVAIDPIVTDGIQLKVTNDGAKITATLPQDVPNDDGDGACILVKYWS